MRLAGVFALTKQTFLFSTESNYSENILISYIKYIHNDKLRHEDRFQNINVMAAIEAYSRVFKQDFLNIASF